MGVVTKGAGDRPLWANNSVHLGRRSDVFGPHGVSN